MVADTIYEIVLTPADGPTGANLIQTVEALDVRTHAHCPGSS